MIFRKRRRKSSNFAAEILCRNGLILFHWSFSGKRSGGIPGRFFHIPNICCTFVKRKFRVAINVIKNVTRQFELLQGLTGIITRQR